MAADYGFYCALTFCVLALLAVAAGLVIWAPG
jgi:hypothetical protein